MPGETFHKVVLLLRTASSTDATNSDGYQDHTGHLFHWYAFLHQHVNSISLKFLAELPADLSPPYWLPFIILQLFGVSIKSGEAQEVGVYFIMEHTIQDCNQTITFKRCLAIRIYFKMTFGVVTPRSTVQLYYLDKPLREQNYFSPCLMR